MIAISQHIARVERSWHKALATLMKLQDRRRKEEIRRPAPAEKPAEKAPAPSPIHALPQKNDEQSQKRGDQIPRKEVGSSANEGSVAEKTQPRDTLAS